MLSKDDARRIILFAVEFAALSRMKMNPQELAIAVYEMGEEVDSFILTQSTAQRGGIARRRALGTFKGQSWLGGSGLFGVSLGVKGSSDAKDTEIAILALKKAEDLGIIYPVEGGG